MSWYTDSYRTLVQLIFDIFLATQQQTAVKLKFWILLHGKKKLRAIRNLLDQDPILPLDLQHIHRLALSPSRQLSLRHNDHTTSLDIKAQTPSGHHALQQLVRETRYDLFATHRGVQDTTETLNPILGSIKTFTEFKERLETRSTSLSAHNLTLGPIFIQKTSGYCKLIIWVLDYSSLLQILGHKVAKQNVA